MLAEKKYHALANARATAPITIWQPYGQTVLLLLEPVAILSSINKAFDHAARVRRIRIQHRDPVQIQQIRIASEIAKVLHHHKRLVVVLRIDLAALSNLSERLC